MDPSIHPYMCKYVQSPVTREAGSQRANLAVLSRAALQARHPKLWIWIYIEINLRHHWKVHEEKLGVALHPAQATADLTYQLITAQSKRAGYLPAEFHRPLIGAALMKCLKKINHTCFTYLSYIQQFSELYNLWYLSWIKSNSGFIKRKNINTVSSAIK